MKGTSRMAGEHEREGNASRTRGPVLEDVRYWLISKPRRDGTGALVPRLTDGGRVLPVFSSEEEARAFLLDRGSPFEGWRIEEARAGRLLSTLLGPYCAGVETVTLDPMAGFPAGVSAALVGVDRGRFARRLLDHLVGRGGPRDAPLSPRDRRR